MREINISLAAEELFSIGGFPVTNSFLSMVVLSTILIIVFTILARRLKAVPTKGQLFAETFVDGVYGFVKQVAGSDKAARRIFPLFSAMALFFLISNLIGVLPGMSAITANGTTIWRPPTSDYTIVFGITVVMFFVWQFTAIVTGGLVHHAGKFFNFSGFKKGILTGVIDFVMGIMDIIGEVAKIISLSFRLFGNIFAGEAIFAVIIGLAPYVVPIPFTVMSMFSGIIQAFVFPILVLIFISMSVATQESKTDEDKDMEVQRAS